MKKIPVIVSKFVFLFAVISWKWHGNANGNCSPVESIRPLTWKRASEPFGECKLKTNHSHGSCLTKRGRITIRENCTRSKDGSVHIEGLHRSVYEDDQKGWMKAFLSPCSQNVTNSLIGRLRLPPTRLWKLPSSQLWRLPLAWTLVYKEPVCRNFF